MTNETVAPGAETSATLTNDKRKSDLMKQVAAFGTESALGRDSLPKLAHVVVEAAADGVINSTSKDAKGNTAAAIIYDRYMAADSKRAIHEHSAGGKRANVSKLQQLILLGEMSTVDGKAIMLDAFKARENMIADSEKVKPAYPFYVEVARVQRSTGKPLSLRELEQLVLKDGPKEKTLEGELKRALAILENLVTGEGKDKIKDTDERTEAAFHAIKERMEAIATMKKRNDLLQQAAKLGLKLA